VVAVALVLSASFATAGVAAPPAEAARSFGNQPIDDVLFWAGQYASGGPLGRCSGLSMPQLSAMMIVPTFTETGSSGGQVPAPMTLSRWDTQSALWAFGDKGTPYQGAFWHPGIGMWQFDSAGGWNLTAATAINSFTSAEQAAKVMATRYCASSSSDVTTKIRYAWGPWSYCASPTAGAPDCMAVFREVFDGSMMSVVRAANVGRLGGMQERSCQVGGIGNVGCWYVDPARGEGNRVWASVSPNIPTPLTKPFYVFEANGREYRYWLAADSGYGATVVASKPVTSNARTSLQWSFAGPGTGLCDVSTGAGSCSWSAFTRTGLDAEQVSVAANPDGRLEALMIAPGGAVLDLWQHAPNSPFVGGVVLPGVSRVREIATHRNRAGRIEAFALDGDGTVWRNAQTGQGWSGWSSLGSGIVRSLVVGANQDGRLELFAVDTAGNVVHQWENVAGGWSGWSAMASGPVVSVAVATNQDRRMEIMAVTTGGAVIHAWQVAPNAAYAGWLSMGGRVTGRLATVSNLDGRIEVFGRGVDGGLWGYWQVSANGIWAGPGRFPGGALTGDPLVVRNRLGRLEVFAAGPDYRITSLWQLAPGGPWAGWGDLSGPPAYSLDALTPQANGQLVLIARLYLAGIAWSVQLA
jgi:hypothetical protein